MADQVTFIHNALGQSTISNMATEATLKELLNAIGGGKTGSQNKNSLASLTNPFNSLTRRAKSLENGIKATMRPFTGFISMLGKGEVRMSAFGKHLNESVVSKLPVVGGLFSGVAGVAIAGVSILESWNTESKKLAPAGATFGNSMLEFSQIAAQTRLSLDELNTVVGQNVEKFAALGPNINQGIRNFKDFSNAFFRPGNILNERLLNMGYSFKDINEQAIDFLYYSQRTSADSISTNVDVQKSFFYYMKNYDALTKLFGASNKALDDASAKILKDSILQIALNKEDKEVGEKTAIGANTLVRFFGESVAEVFKAQMFGMEVFGGASMDLNLMLGNDLRPIVRRLTEAAKDKDVTAEDMTDISVDVIAEALVLTAGKLDERKNMIELMSVAPDGAKGMYDSIAQAADNVIRKDLTGKTKDQVKAMILEELKQQDRAETITEIIRAMEQAARYFKGEFQTVLIEELKGMGVAFEQYDLPGLFRKAGEWAADWTVKAWSQIQSFFRMMSDSDGRDYIGSAFSNMMGYYGNKFTATIKNLTALAVQSVVPESVNTTVSGMNDRLREKWGWDIPLIRTKKDSLIEDQQDEFSYYAGKGRAERFYNLAQLPDNRASFDPNSTKGIVEGTVVYPDYVSMGVDDLGPLVFKDGKWQSQRAVKMREGLDAMYKNPWAMGGMGYGGVYGAELGVSSAVDDVNDLLSSAGNTARLNMLGQKTGIGGGNLKALVMTSSGHMKDVNAKYADKFQTMIDMLEGGMGLKITKLTAKGDGLVGLQIQTEQHGTKWFDSLSEVEKAVLFRGMMDIGLLDHGEYEFSQAVERQTQSLNDGIMSAYKLYGGPHADIDKFRTGTLETTGRLFNDFGRKRQVALSGDKAILTKPQFDTIKEGAAQIPMKDLVNSVNSSVQEMIRITKLEIAHNRTMLSVA